MRNRISWGPRIFSLSQSRDKTKNIFLYFFTELKTNHLSYSVYKQITCFKINFHLQYFQLLEARKRIIWYGRELIVEGQISGEVSMRRIRQSIANEAVEV